MARATRSPKASQASLNPNTKSLEWASMSYKWWLMNTCLAGTAAMRDAGQQLLPKHQGESQIRYNDRIQNAVFTNFVKLTVEFLVGKPFQEKVTFRETCPQALKDLESDVDGQGNDLTTVSMDFFRKGFEKAWSWLMVDFPSVLDNVKPTLADQKANNLRPYWNVLSADNVIEATGEMIEGKWAWTRVRIAESRIETNGFEEGVVNYIRMYELKNLANDPQGIANWRVFVTVYKEQKPGVDKWDVIQVATQTTASRIPLVRFQTSPDGDMALEDLLYLNVRHWQSSADQAACIVMARFPVLAAAGVDDEKQYTIGPYELLKSADPQSKFYYVENQGTAIGVGNSDIAGLENNMAMYGAQMLKKRPDRETATSRIVDETQNMAPLQIMVLQFMSAMETVCDFTLMWLEDAAFDDENTYGVDVNMDFAMSAENERMMSFFENARLQGDVSRIQFFAVAKELGYVPDSFNPTLNETQIAAERQSDMEFQQSVAAAKGVQGNDGSGTGSPVNDPNDPKIKRQNTPAV